MKSLVVYDSFFGNTEKIAYAIGDAIGGVLGTSESVKVVKVADASPQQLQGIQLLIVGSPTRAFRPSPAIAHFLAGIPANGLRDVKVAAFDTRMMITDKTPGILRVLARWFGYADTRISRTLLRKGGRATLPSVGFFVLNSEGPLADGELERAAEWARKLVVA